MQKLDSNLSFESHFSNLCKKTIQKVQVLGRIASHIDT